MAELTGDDAEHLVRVLRAEVGQVYEITDSKDLYLAKITVARKTEVQFEVMERLAVEAAVGTLTLVTALFKFDRFEWMLEKATELGVDTIVAFEAERSEKGLSQAVAKRMARWERVAVEASQQSRRIRRPEIKAVGLDEAFETMADSKLLLDEDEKAAPILRVLGPAQNDAHAALLLGPEGGWTERERAQALGRGWKACSLGANILRAETAGMAGLSILRAWLGSAASMIGE